MRCWGLPRAANPAYLGGSLVSGLLCVAPYCVPGGEWCQVKSGDSGLRVAGFLAIQMCQMLGGSRIDEAKPQRETSTSVYASPAHSPGRISMQG
jgi:uncharacterized protein YraI